MALDKATAQGASVTVTTAASWIPELWTSEVLKAREKRLVMVNKIMHLRPEGLKYGDTVNLPYLGNETALNKTAETAVTYSANTDKNIALSINKYKYVAKLIEDIASVQSKYDMFANYRDKIAYALADAVDADILALTGIANSVGTASSIAATGVITTSNIIKAVRFLDSNNVPQDDRYIVLDAYGREDLLGITDFIRYDAGGKSPAPVNTGVIGEIYGLKVLFSNNVWNDGAGVAYGMVFHKDAFAIALQKDVTMKTEYSVDYIGTKMVGYNIYGLTYARTDHAVLFPYAQA